MWQSLLRNWIWGAVKTAATNSTPSQSKRTEPVTARCDVGIVFALSQESGCFVDRLSHVTTTHGHGFTVRDGSLKETRIVVIDSGAGQSAAARATDALIVAHRPRLVISAGFAGGLRAGIERGHIIMADAVVNEAGERLAIDLRLDRNTQPSLHVGPLITVDRIVRTSADKRTLHEHSGGIAVDMESFAVADVCRKFATPFMSIRAISDSVNDQLPREIGALVRKRSVAGRLGVAVAAFTRRPSTVKDLWNLKQNALEQAERLAKFLVSTVNQLPTNRV